MSDVRRPMPTAIIQTHARMNPQANLKFDATSSTVYRRQHRSNWRSRATDFYLWQIISFSPVCSSVCMSHDGIVSKRLHI